MASDGVTPEPYKPDIFEKGQGVCVVDGKPNAVECWVQSVAQKANAQVDWHYSGGRANVLHLGDNDSHQRVLEAISELKGDLDGTVMSIGGPSLYRDGDTVPTGTIVVDPDVGPVVGM